MAHHKKTNFMALDHIALGIQFSGCSTLVEHRPSNQGILSSYPTSCRAVFSSLSTLFFSLSCVSFKQVA